MADLSLPFDGRRRAGFLDALKIQARVVWALTLRETQTRFGHARRIGYLWAVIEPFCHIVAFASLAELMHRGAALGGSIQVFYATGVVPFFLFRDLSYHLAPGLLANRALLYFPVVKNLDVVAARAFLECATWIVVGFLTMTVFLCCGLDAVPDDPLVVLEAMGAMALLGVGFGTIGSVIAMFFDNWERCVHMFVRILYVASGVYFLPLHLPRAAIEVVWWFPTFHGIEWFREGFYGGYHSPFLSKAYILAWGVALVAFGLVLERVLRRHMEVE